MISRARIQGWLEQLLHTHDTPTRTAFAFGLGVFLGFSPILGLHAILGLILAFVFRLNRVAVLLGVYSNLPWILPAYYTVSTIGGAALLGVDIQPRVLEQAIMSVSSASWRHPDRGPQAAGALLLGLPAWLDDRRSPARGGCLPGLTADDRRAPPKAGREASRRPNPAI